MKALVPSRRQHRPLLGAIATALALAATGAFTPALAAAGGLEPVEPYDFSGVEAEKRVVDTILTDRPAAASIPARSETFVDQHGHRITIETDLTELDLRPYAAMLAGTIHYSEIEHVPVEVVQLADIPSICGSAFAVACYGADLEDSVAPYQGRIWIAADDTDLPHTVVHEYGHHVDNQLDNLGHLPGWGCSFDGDGSRNWFFARQLTDDILGAGFTCSPDANWENLLPELYAEDYAQLNGVSGFDLADVIFPPTQAQKNAIAFDFANPFAPRVVRLARWLRRDGLATKSLTVRHWTFLAITLRGPRGTDFDLFLYKRGGRRPIARSIRPGSRERIERIVKPGQYVAVAYAYRGSATARLAIFLD